MRELDECDGLDGACGLARGHAEPCRTCFVDSPLSALAGATERLEAAARPDCVAPNSERLCLCGRHGPAPISAPTAALALAEAEALVIRAARLARTAGKPVLAKGLVIMANGVSVAARDEEGRAGAMVDGVTPEAPKTKPVSRCLACLHGPAPGHTICIPCEREWDMQAETVLEFVARKRGVSLETAQVMSDRKKAEAGHGQ